MQRKQQAWEERQRRDGQTGQQWCRRRQRHTEAWEGDRKQRDGHRYVASHKHGERTIRRREAEGRKRQRERGREQTSVTFTVKEHGFCLMPPFMGHPGTI